MNPRDCLLGPIGGWIGALLSLIYSSLALKFYWFDLYDICLLFREYVFDFPMIPGMVVILIIYAVGFLVGWGIEVLIRGFWK